MEIPAARLDGSPLLIRVVNCDSQQKKTWTRLFQQQVIENIELNIDLLTEAEPTSKAKKIKNAASKPKTVKKKLIIIED